LYTIIEKYYFSQIPADVLIRFSVLNTFSVPIGDCFTYFRRIYYYTIRQTFHKNRTTKWQQQTVFVVYRWCIIFVLENV